MFQKESFRPQQGLPIMNSKRKMRTFESEKTRSRPQQGLPIMNYTLILLQRRDALRFRPQQGLSIMNTKRLCFY